MNDFGYKNLLKIIYSLAFHEQIVKSVSRQIMANAIALASH